jgi:hypothetical protein
VRAGVTQNSRTEPSQRSARAASALCFGGYRLFRSHRYVTGMDPEGDGGPCRGRTYDQLINRSFLACALFPSKTSTYASPAVSRFVDLRIDKTLSVLLGGFSNGTVVNRYELSLSNLQPADRMCIKLT